MNEVTHIHLGRQPYTIAVEAHQDLRHYLADIEKKVHDPEVTNEVELRMSELLIERGVTGEKVILPEDIRYLKDQLGDPDDFSEEETDSADGRPASGDRVPRRLFRDTDNAIIAGVAAGVANYTGLDATLVRLLFVLLTLFSGGVGIVIYLLLWLVLPPAETASEKLQMHGKSVTLGALKDSVSTADINGAAQRINSKIIPVINALFRIAVKLAGIGFIVAGLGIICAVSALKAYMLLHNDRLFQENLFPVGIREQWLLGIAMGLAIIAAIFLLLTGVAAFKRKWPIKGWVTGILLAIFVVGSVAGAALTADAVPRVRERYETSLHTTAIKDIGPFNQVQTNGDIDIAYISSPTYGVNVHYSGNPDLSKLKINVSNGTLHIDSSELDAVKHCTMLCLYPRYDMTVQVYAPNVGKFITPSRTDIFYPDTPGAPVPSLPAKPSAEPAAN